MYVCVCERERECVANQAIKKEKDIDKKRVFKIKETLAFYFT